MRASRKMNSRGIFSFLLSCAAIAGALSVCVLWLSNPGGHTLDAQTPNVPVVKADAGPCSADFTVTDAENKSVYDAKIQVRVRSGFMSKRKTDLEIGTNSDGKARVEGLPARVKKPLEFRVLRGDLQKSVSQDPAAECHANFTVALGTQ